MKPTHLPQRRRERRGIAEKTNHFLISEELRPQALRTRSTLTPTLSHEYAGEGAGILPLLPRATKGPLVAPGEGWGRNGAFEPHTASPRSGPGLQARTRTASEGPPAGWLVYAEGIDAFTLLGAGLILAGNLLNLKRAGASGPK